MEDNNLEIPVNDDSEEINKLEDIDSLKAEIELLKEENSKTKSNLMWKVRKLIKNKEKDKVKKANKTSTRSEDIREEMLKKLKESKLK